MVDGGWLFGWVIVDYFEQIVISSTYRESHLSFDGGDFLDATFYHFYFAREFKTDLTDATCDNDNNNNNPPSSE